MPQKQKKKTRKRNHADPCRYKSSKESQGVEFCENEKKKKTKQNKQTDDPRILSYATGVCETWAQSESESRENIWMVHKKEALKTKNTIRGGTSDKRGGNMVG